MKKIFVFIYISAIIATGLYIINPTHTTILGDAMTAGVENEGSDRARYEYEMLHDPQTGQIPAHIRVQELDFVKNLPKASFGNRWGKTTSALDWTSRGPWNVGGRTRALALDVTDEQRILAGSCSGGMWLSKNGGGSWTPTFSSTSHLGVTCLAQDVRRGHQNVWYYGTGEAYGASAGATGAYYLGNGIYKSVDSGVTWNVLSATTSTATTTFDMWGDLIWNIVTDASDTTHDVVLAAAYGGLYRSADGGTTWTNVKGGLSGAVSYFTDIAITSRGVVYATLSSDGAQRGIYRSTDGITYTNITPTGFPTTYNRIKIGISPSNEEQVYFLGNTPGFGMPDTNFVGTVEWNSLWRYTYVSGDGSGTGGAWQDRTMSLPTTGGLFDKFACQGSYDLVVKVKPNDTNVVYIGGTNLYRSTNAFRDATRTTFIGGYAQGATLPIVDMYANHHPDQHELVFYPSNPQKMLSGNDGGVFKTDDNSSSTVSWQPLNNGYLTTMFYSCAIDHGSTNNIIIGGAQDNGSWYTNSSSATAPWVTPRGGDGSYCAIADGGLAYYLSIQNGKMMRAKLNASGGVDSFARIDPIGGARYLFINPYFLDPNNNNIMYLAGGKYLWRNNDLSGIPYASNWDTISTNWVRWPDSALGTSVVTAIGISKTPANVVYYGTSANSVYKITNANVGTPTPVNINPRTPSPLFPGGSYVSCVAVDPSNADHVMVTFANYGVYSIYYTADGGANWSKVGGNLEANIAGSGTGPSVRWAKILPVAGGTVYLVGTSTGLYATTELNSTATIWVQQGVNTIGNGVVNMIDYRDTDGLVVVATHSNGIFASHITRVEDINAVSNLTATSSIDQLQVYPNPCQQTINIGYTLSREAAVTVAIYGIDGTLHYRSQQPTNLGQQHHTLNTAHLPTGLYLATLQTEDGIVVERFMKR